MYKKIFNHRSTPSYTLLNATAFTLFTAAILVVTLLAPRLASAALQDQFDFTRQVAQGGQFSHKFTVRNSARHQIKLNWNKPVNANIVISDQRGATVLALADSKPGEQVEVGSKWLTEGQTLTATVYIQAHAGLSYALDIDADIANGGNGGATDFTGSISKNQQIWHWFRVDSTATHTLQLNWTQNGANADLVLTKTDGSVVARAQSSSGDVKQEVMNRYLRVGEEYYAKVFMRAGNNASYTLNVSTDGGGGGSSSGGSSSSGSSSSGSSSSGSSSGGSSSSGSSSGSHNAGYTYLNDANTGVRGGGFLNGVGYPRVMMTETQSTKPPYGRYSTYQALAVQGSGLYAASQAQKTQPIPVHRMFTPTVTLEERFDYRDVRCTQGLGIPFEDSTAVTGGCGVWAGHLVYSAGTQLSQSMARNAGSIRVNNASGFRPGTYLVIYDGGVKSFRNAEHVKIRSISGNTIFLAERFKSASRARSAGAWVRQHADGGRGAKSWVFNLSTQCPRDGNGRTIAEYMVNWLASNLNRDVDGIYRDVTISGLTFDVDTYVDVFTKNSDVNNDLVTDRGVSPSGVHWWGDGVDQFYRMLRNRFPSFAIVGGVQLSGGYDSLSGVQIEGFPNGQLWKGIDDFSQFNTMMSTYLYRMKRSDKGPAMVQNLLKFGTTLYPTHSVSRYGNAPARLGLALTTMDGGFFHHENTSTYVDTWYDEYAVDSNPSSANFGNALQKSDYRTVRSNTGWLGQPTGKFQRLYDANQFKLSNATSTSTFESLLDGWTTNGKVSIWRTSEQKRDGSYGLMVSAPSSYDYNRSGAQVRGPSVNVQAGQDYTLVFAARADKDRTINVKVGRHTEGIPLGDAWRRYVVSFKATESGAKQIRFDVGLINSRTYFDSVYFFRGNANVFRRDFDRGSVIANVTNRPVTVNLGDGYRRIRGTQDAVNNGANLGTTVTVPAYDALFALKRQ